MAELKAMFNECWTTNWRGFKDEVMGKSDEDAWQLVQTYGRDQGYIAPSPKRRPEPPTGAASKEALKVKGTLEIKRIAFVDCALDLDCIRQPSGLALGATWWKQLHVSEVKMDVENIDTADPTHLLERQRLDNIIKSGLALIVQGNKQALDELKGFKAHYEDPTQTRFYPNTATIENMGTIKIEATTNPQTADTKMKIELDQTVEVEINSKRGLIPANSWTHVMQDAPKGWQMMVHAAIHPRQLDDYVEALANISPEIWPTLRLKAEQQDKKLNTHPSTEDPSSQAEEPDGDHAREAAKTGPFPTVDWTNTSPEYWDSVFTEAFNDDSTPNKLTQHPSTEDRAEASTHKRTA